MNYTSLKGNAFHLDFVFLSFEFSYTQFHDKKFGFTISSNYKFEDENRVSYQLLYVTKVS